MLLLAQGKPNKLICRDLRLSEGTVKVHVSAILKALNVHSRSQVIVELARRGIDVDAPAVRELARRARSKRPRDAAAALAPALLARARADQVALLYAGWHRTSLSMLLGAALLCFVLWEQASPWWIGGVGRADRREPGMARRARARVAPAAARHRCDAALGSLLVGRVDAGRRAVGTRRARHVSAIGGAPGAAHRVPVRRRAGRTQPHRGVPAVVLRVRAAGAGAADRARRARRRPGAPVHGAGDERSCWASSSPSATS